jgi:4-hydroxy-2-oxoheptanedioate aldolase
VGVCSRREEKQRVIVVSAGRENRFKRRLQNGDVCIGSSVRLGEPGLCELLGVAGFDFVVLDGEHGVADGSTLERLIQGCLVGGVASIARPLKPDDSEAIMRSLDLGAQGVLVPHLRGPDDARRLQDAAWYPPRGRRGFGPGRSAGWGRVPAAGYLQSADEELVLAGIIEDAIAVDRIDDIAACQLDLLWVGTGDLTFDLGYPGQVDHPAVLAAADRVLKACQRRGVACAFPVRDVESALQAREAGYRVLGYGGAEQYIMQTSRRFLESLGR